MSVANAWVGPTVPQGLGSAPDLLRLDVEVGRMRQLAERHARSHRALGAIIRKLVNPNGEARYVEIRPRVVGGTVAQQPIAQRTDPDPWWPCAPSVPSKPLQAHPGDACLSLSDAMTEVVGFTVYGLRGADLEGVVDSVGRQQLQDGNFKPVFITDSPDFSTFVTRGYSFEYVSSYRRFLTRNEEAERAVRRDNVVAKWGLARVVDRDDARRNFRDHPPLAALSRHNSEMSSSVHRDRFAWLIETLRTAISLERFDVVGGLADYLLTFFNGLDKPLVIPAAKALCRKFIAFGEFESLRQFLFKNIASLKKDDMLFTLFSVYCTAASQYLTEFATLPSGKINFYYLSKRMSVAGEHAVPDLVAVGDGQVPGTNLLLANFFATRSDSSLYKMFVNRALGKHTSPLLSKIALGQSNVLKTVTFESTAPAKDQTDLVTIIMSAHDAADTIGYAARSILSQSYSNVELLICDDCSTDATDAELAKLKSDPRVRLFRSRAQQGTYGIRNSLIAEASGNYITFHDSDDFAFPDRIERQMAELKRHGAAAVVAQWFRVGCNGEFVFSSDHSVARLAVVSLLAPRQIFERYGPYRSSRIGADTEFFETIRMSLGVDAVRVMQSPVMFGLAAEGSLTRSPGTEATEDGYRAPARRAYAAAAARLRIIGEASRAAEIDEVLAMHGLLLPTTGVEMWDQLS